MKLSTHFELEEFLVSDTAARADIPMEPTHEVVAELQRLCTHVLEPLRTLVGRPIVITSGYRPKALNALIGGSENSDHIYGRAADLICPQLKLEDFVFFAIAQCDSLPVQQCIVEFNRWLHVSICKAGATPARKYLVASHSGGKTVYKPWEAA